LAGKSGIKLTQPFPEISPLPLALIGSLPARLDDLVELAVRDVLVDARLVSPLPNCAVAIGSSRGCQPLWEDLAIEAISSRYAISKLSGGVYSDRFDWLSTLPDRAALLTARLIGSQAPVFAPMAACSTSIWAIARGSELIRSGTCEMAIVGSLEAPISRLTLTGFQQMGALASTGCYPFDRDREGLVLGEGGAVFVLESESSVRARNVPIYGEVLGFGFTCDAERTNAPASNLRSSLKAISNCLQQSQLAPERVDFIHAHGTGTKLNDRHEADIINKIFPHQPPVISSKGATGHTLGASGAIAIALSLMAIKSQQFSPCVGLRESDCDLDLITSVRSSAIATVLCLSFGFGGQNAAIALSN
jgi:3-oxoacyl-[acyl-carrier-protein] synthase II